MSISVCCLINVISNDKAANTDCIIFGLTDQGSCPRSSILEAITIHQDKYSLKYLHYIMITKVNTLKINY